MTDLSELKPQERQRIIDLVEDAGVDIADWASSKRGTAGAAMNPKYCYEWAFVQPGEVVVLNLWFDLMKVDAAGIFQDVNYRQFANQQRALGRAVVAERAERMDRAIQQSFQDELPIRVVVCDGFRRNAQERCEVSRVSKRLLDPVAWSVATFDAATGAARLTRASRHDRFVDQFSLPNPASPTVEQYVVSGKVYKRDREVRKQVLIRAGGKCEFCGDQGFSMGGGRVYLETHHIVPLCDGGEDSARNVSALCPNHHREAHHGENKTELRQSLLKNLSGQYEDE